MTPRPVVAWALAACLLAAAPAPARQAPERRAVQLEVLFTSDIHGGLGSSDASFLNPEFPPPLGGGASAATYLRRVREAARSSGARVLLFDSGDMFRGTPLGAADSGAAIIEWMNRMGYDAATFGNHDFDLGRDNAERLAGLARFPILVGNLADSATGRRVPWVRDHVTFEVGGVRIAVLGYITESTVQMAFARNIAGLTFRRVIDVLPDDVRRVRAGGADLVFVLLHHGLPYRTEMQDAYDAMLAREARGDLEHFGMDAMEIAHAVPGVDAIFGGHTHQGYGRPWEDPVTHTLVFEPYANGSSLGHVTFTVDPKIRLITGYRTHFDRGALLTLLEDEVWPDSAEARILGHQVAEAERGLAEVVGRSEAPLAGGPAESGLLGFVVADAYREELGADFAVQNTGGVRGRLGVGDITQRDLLEVSPFGNQMVLVRMRGGMLRAVLEDKLGGRADGIFISGGRVRFDPSRPEGDRIVSIQVAGAPLDTARIYRVAMTDYLSEGNSGMARLRAIPPEDVQPAGFTDREVLARYIRRVGVLRITNDGRWLRLRHP